MTEEPREKCDVEDILCQMQALSHLRGLQNVLGEEKFKSSYPEFEGLSEMIIQKIEKQDSRLKSALGRCGLSSIGELESETTNEEPQEKSNNNQGGIRI